jgi:hypothetical protein
MITALVKPIYLRPLFRASSIRLVTPRIMDHPSRSTRLSAFVLGTAARPGAVGTGVIIGRGRRRNGARIGLRICASWRVGVLELPSSAAGSFHGPEHQNDGDANHRDREDDCIGYISVHAMHLRPAALPVVACRLSNRSRQAARRIDHTQLPRLSSNATFKVLPACSLPGTGRNISSNDYAENALTTVKAAVEPGADSKE